MSPEMLVMVSVVGVAGVAYFAWLGTNVVSMGKAIVGIEKDVKSLLGTRDKQSDEKGAGVDQRLHDLEKGAPAAPPAADADIAADAADATAAAATDKAGEIRKAPKK